MTFVKILPKFSSLVTSKKIMYTGIGTMSILGYYRGHQEFYYREIKNKNKILKFQDYFNWTTFGIISMSCYLNPAFSYFALYYEYEQLQQILDNKFDKDKYCSNPFLYYRKL